MNCSVHYYYDINLLSFFVANTFTMKERAQHGNNLIHSSRKDVHKTFSSNNDKMSNSRRIGYHASSNRRDIDMEDDKDGDKDNDAVNNNDDNNSVDNEEDDDVEGGDDDDDNDDDSDSDGDDDDDDDDDDDEKDRPLTNSSNVTGKSSKAINYDNMPLYERLLAQNRSTEQPLSNSVSTENTNTRRIRKVKEETDSEKRKLGRSNKNHPAELPSNRPVKRLRVDANNKSNKFRDPRFSDISGVLDDKIFAKNYSFLDEYREKEIDLVAKSMKKIKNVDNKAEIKAELMKMKQQHAERRRGLAVMSKLEEMKKEEKEKVKSGKNPFFLKKSVKKTIALEERYNELKKEGKLHKYMEKRRRKNASKDRRYLPE